MAKSTKKSSEEESSSEGKKSNEEESSIFKFTTRDFKTNKEIELKFETYEELVAAKRERNLQFLKHSGLEGIKERITESVSKEKASQRGLATRKRENKAKELRDLPRRKSSRIRGETAQHVYITTETGRSFAIAGADSNTLLTTGSEKFIKTEESSNPEYFRRRVNDGSPLSVGKAIELTGSKWADEKSIVSGREFMGRLSDVIVPTGYAIPSTTNYQERSCGSIEKKKSASSPDSVSDISILRDQIAMLHVNDETQVAKVTPQRIYAMEMHPSNNAILVCAGDKDGNLGIWHAREATRSSLTDSVYLFKPHGGAINHLEWNSSGTSLFSQSYDSSIREFDLEKQVFTEVFAAYDDSKEFESRPGYNIDEGYKFYIQHSLLDHRNERCMFACTSLGSILHMDFRTGKDDCGLTFNQKGVSEKKINTVSLHPNGYTLATAGLDTTVKLWDVRKFGSKARPPKFIAEKNCGKSVNSAFFSPSGRSLLATTMAHALELYEDSHLAKGGVIPVKKRVHHDNLTGRWLSTFMARWHPTTTDEIFVVGCMKQPRRINVYDGKNGKLIHDITGDSFGAVASRCCFHRNVGQLIVAGGNSSGRVSIALT